VSDGAAAAVLTELGDALAFDRAVALRATAHVQDFLPMSRRDILKFEGCAHVWQKALGVARLTLDDLSFVETHDCFTIAELIEYEAMGLAPYGGGAHVVQGSDPIGRQVAGQSIRGLKAKGHPIGATGVSMHVMTAMQLCGVVPADIRVSDARLGSIFNMGGAAVANYVSILERVR
jgi:acetyl-CoA C-acetyltransferase